MSSEKIVTLFDTPEHARAAERNLIKAGFDEGDISIIESHHIREHEDENKGTGIWRRLFGNDVEDEHAQIYSEAVRTNGAVLSLKVKEEQQATALAILNRHQTVDITTSRLSAGQNYAEAPSMVVTDKTTHPWLTGDEPEEEILRLAREELDVGKRLVKEGSTRIRRYVTEENVSETVKLREQHAEIFRYKVGEPVDAEDVDWSEKEVVVDEFAEKPVINKTAHITEEVQVKKANTEHDETVTDTVRQQHIDIEHSRDDGKRDMRPKK